MNRVQRKNVVLVGVSVILLLIALSTRTISNKEIESNQVNLALRQVAHTMYQLVGNDSTKIDPVVEHKDHFYSFDVKDTLLYDSLAYVIDRAFADYELKQDYAVYINACGGLDILIGYQKQALEDGVIPCMGREFTEACSTVTVQVKKSKAELRGMYWLMAGLSLFLVGFTIYPKIRGQKAHTVEKLVEKPENNHIQFGSLQLDMVSQTIIHGDEKISLTFREAKLLEFLAIRKNQVIPRDDIQENIWGDEGVIVGRSLDVFISRLRKKISVDPSISIKNIHGIGYKLLES